MTSITAATPVVTDFWQKIVQGVIQWAIIGILALLCRQLVLKREVIIGLLKNPQVRSSMTWLGKLLLWELGTAAYIIYLGWKIHSATENTERAVAWTSIVTMVWLRYMTARRIDSAWRAARLRIAVDQKTDIAEPFQHPYETYPEFSICGTYCSFAVAVYFAVIMR